MGTNYYVEGERCPHCGRGDDDLHIGKSSAGWCFALHVIPELGLNSLDEWLEFLKEKKIQDEYGTVVSLEELIKRITQRSWENDFLKPPYGYISWAAFHKSNHSEFGQNGLLRHKIDGRHCIGHGSGTWDLITGEFS